jgi:hypothetical protein
MKRTISLQLSGRALKRKEKEKEKNFDTHFKNAAASLPPVALKEVR